MNSLRIQNIHTLITCDDQDRVLKNATITIRDGVIVDLCEGAAKDDFDGDVLDATGMWLYPGLINTHHHLYQYFTRNLPDVQNLELFDWLTALYGIWKGLDERTVYFSSLCGMGELMKYGCTTCLDHHYVFPAHSAEGLLPAQFQAAEELGIRIHATRGSMSLSKKDGGLPPDSVVQSVDEILLSSQRLIEQWHDPKPYSMRQLALAPCSPFSVTADLLKESAKLARAYGVRLHTHLCETKDEERFTLEKTGLRPYTYMESLDWVGPDVWYAHGIHFNDEELKALADTGTGVAHCPCSNMKLSSGVCRIPDMLRLGVPVGLAVDGSASNDGSNLLEEMRTAYLLHRLKWGADAPSGYDILKMATRGSANLLGRTDIGQIAPGQGADMFLIDSRRMELTGAGLDPMSVFGTVGYHRPVDYTIVNGRVTVKNGNLVGVDEGRAYFEGEAAVKRLLQG